MNWIRVFLKVYEMKSENEIDPSIPVNIMSFSLQDIPVSIREIIEKDRRQKKFFILSKNHEIEM